MKIVQELVKLANSLGKRGFRKEADMVDSILRQANEPSGYVGQKELDRQGLCHYCGKKPPVAMIAFPGARKEDNKVCEDCVKLWQNAGHEKLVVYPK